MRGGKKDKFRRFNIWLLVILERKMRENGWKEIGKKKNVFKIWRTWSFRLKGYNKYLGIVIEKLI